jgi:hypothetical protein
MSSELPIYDRNGVIVDYTYVDPHGRRFICRPYMNSNVSYHYTYTEALYSAATPSFMPRDGRVFVYENNVFMEYIPTEEDLEEQQQDYVPFFLQAQQPVEAAEAASSADSS